MEPEILFTPSAFKHGVNEEDIRHAYNTKIHAGPLEGYENKYAFIGFNRAGNPIEVFFNPIGDDTIKVFHAMGCRNGILAQLQPYEKTMNYTDMTDEEYDALDEELTQVLPKLGPNGTGWISQREMRILGLTNMTINYLLTKARADHKAPAQIIDELVRKEIAAAV